MSDRLWHVASDDGVGKGAHADMQQQWADGKCRGGGFRLLHGEDISTVHSFHMVWVYECRTGELRQAGVHAAANRCLPVSVGLTALSCPRSRRASPAPTIRSFRGVKIAQPASKCGLDAWSRG